MVEGGGLLKKIYLPCSCSLIFKCFVGLNTFPYFPFCAERPDLQTNGQRLASSPRLLGKRISRLGRAQIGRSGALQQAAKSAVPTIGYTIPYAVSRIILAISRCRDGAADEMTIIELSVSNAAPDACSGLWTL